MFVERPGASRLIVFACSLIFFGLGLYKLTFFGLEYDEALFINAALGDLDGTSFVYRKFHGIPILTYSYIGALKSWLYAAIFKLFNVSLLSIRLPVLILATTNLFLVFRLVKQLVGLQFALLFILILSIDLTFLTLQRFDKGPTTIETSLKLTVLLVAVNQQLLWRKKILWILLLMLLGVFNKLNFIWFVNAVFGVFFLQRYNVFSDFINRKITFSEFAKTPLFEGSIVYIAFIVSFFVYLKIMSIQPTAQISLDFVVNHTNLFFHDLKYTLMQRNVFHIFGWTYKNSFWNYIGNGVLASVLVINVWLYFTGKIAFRSVQTQVFILLFLLAVQYIITPDAQKIWHMFVLFPMVTFAVIHTFWLVGKDSRSRTFIMLPIIALFIVGNASATTLFYTKVNQETCVTELFIPEVKEVERHLQAEKPTNVVTTDWGIHTQMQAFLHDRHRFFEPFRMFRFPDLFDQWWEENRELLVIGKEFVILQPIGTDIQQEPYYNYNVTFEEEWTAEFVSFLEANNFIVSEEKVINNSCGDRLFIIYKAKYVQSVN